MPCILAECWMTRSNRLARDTTSQPAPVLPQVGAALTLAGVVQNARQSHSPHTADAGRDQRRLRRELRSRWTSEIIT